MEHRFVKIFRLRLNIFRKRIVILSFFFPIVFTHCVFLRGAGANATVMTMELMKILLFEAGPAFLDCSKIGPC